MSLDRSTHHQAHRQRREEGHKQNANYCETDSITHFAQDVSTPIYAGLWCERA